jgi:hypothetical protein
MKQTKHDGQKVPDFVQTFTNNILTYSWSSALLEEPPILQLLKNFLAFYGT